MGKIVAFWSPYAGKAKVTSSLCAVAGAIGMEHPEISMAISHIKSGSMELEEKLDCRTEQEIKQELYKKSGIAALKLNCRQAVLTAEKIRRSAIPLSMKSLYLYPYVEESLDELTIRLITKDVKQEFDVVCLDLPSGMSGDSLGMLTRVDYVVVVLPQEPRCWEDFFQKNEMCQEGIKYGVLIGGYLEKAKYSINYFLRKKEFKTGGDLIGAIPMNAGYFDAMAEGRTLDFFYRNQRVRKKEENYEFILQAKNAADRIRKKLFFS